MRTTPNRTRSILVAGLVGIVAILGGVAAQPCSAQLTLEFKLTDKDVDKAIERLQNYLWMRQRDNGSWENVVGSHYKRKKGGTTALATLALLESGVPLSDPRMEKAVQNLMAVEMDDLYCYAVRVMAISRAYRFAQRKSFAASIVKDMAWLTQGLPQNGAWHYGGTSKTGDNSASQYGLLALWEADLAGFDQLRKIPKGTMITDGEKEVDLATVWPQVARNLKTSWRAIEREWVKRHRPDHGWTYAAVATPDVKSTMTMTAAGVASLYIVIDKAYAPKMTPGKPRPRTQVFAKADQGMAWLASRLTPKFTQDGYLAFGIQRIASAAGYKYIGQNDWFQMGVKEIAKRASNARRELGGKHGGDVQAAFYLLFLARGRVPVTFNKLERPGTDWDVAPRDIANLTRYLIKEYEKPMAWQIVSVDRPVAEFLDAPILFINGIKPVSLKDKTIAKMREYVLRGGMIVGEATTGSTEFASSFKKMLEKAFPEGRGSEGTMYAWHKLDDDHPLFAGLEKRDRKQIGTVWGMNDPVRTFAVLLSRDHATAWQQFQTMKKRPLFLMGMNLFRYGTGGERLRTRLRPVFAGRTLDAKIKKKIGVIHAGPRWFSDQYAIERLSDKLVLEARIMVDAQVLTDAAEVDPKEMPMIWIVGSGPFTASEKLVAGLKTYVGKGGLVAINANMGNRLFALSAKKLAKAIVPDALPSPLLDTDPIMTGMVYRERGKPIDRSGINQTLRFAGVRKVALTGYRSGTRWGVIVCPHDVFMTMLGAPIYGCKGYLGETSRQIGFNMFLYSLEQAEKVSEGGAK